MDSFSILVSQQAQMFAATAAKTRLLFICEADVDASQTAGRRATGGSGRDVNPGQASSLRRQGNRLAGKSAAGLRRRIGGITGRIVGSGTITSR